MDKFHKPRTHRDKTKYNRRTESEKMQDELEPIVHDWEDEGGAVHPDSSEEMDYSGAFESDIDLGPKTT